MLARQLRAAFEVVELDRLLEPLQSRVVERVQAPQRLAAVQALVEVRHQPHAGADRLAHDAARGDGRVLFARVRADADEQEGRRQEGREARA